jgi:hypothetical protein
MVYHNMLTPHTVTYSVRRSVSHHLVKTAFMFGSKTILAISDAGTLAYLQIVAGRTQYACLFT